MAGYLRLAAIGLALTLGTCPDLPAGGKLVSTVHAQARNGGAQLRRLRVTVNKSQTLRLDFPFTDVLVGSSEIADVIPLSDQTLYVLGKKAGTTNVSVLDAQKKVLAVVDVQVSVDTGMVDQNVRSSGLTVRGQGEHVVVSG